VSRWVQHLSAEWAVWRIASRAR